MPKQESPTEPHRLSTIKRIFLQVSRLLPEQRDAYLREACGDDLTLLKEISDLLQAADQSSISVEEIVADAAADTQQPYSSMPTRIGPYKIIDRIGEGGMGQVLLAERADQQYTQQVAIKLLSTQRPSEELVVRFRSERQILANLNHPCIAKLLDGGETDDGLPYLVMEYLDGRPILEFCNENNLTITDRLELFTQVCDAVQHAHQNFVIHRDIKSSNILVGEDRVPKLLDFGIAKLLESDFSSHTMAVTQLNARLLTPSNASPEQVRGKAVTTATDVYALGLLLYELLTGQSAYRFEGQDSSEIEKVVCQTMPTRPSTLISQSSEALPLLSVTSIEKLKKTLAGDLDTIILCALRKEPERRYPTVREFSQDILRYLQHQPVLARADSLTYRSGKFLRRHRIAAVATITVLSVITGLTAFYTSQLADERNRADLRAQESEQTSQFLISILEGANPAINPGQVTLEQVLDSAAERINEELADVPSIQARMHFVMGQAYWSFDAMEKGKIHLFEAIKSQRKLPPAEENQLDLAYFMRSYSIIHTAMGDYEDAVKYNTEAVDLYRRYGTEDDDWVAYSKNKLGQIYTQLNQLDKAKAALDDAVRIGLATVGPDTRNTADAMNNLAIVEFRLGNVSTSNELYRRALDINQRILPPLHPNVSNSKANFGGSLYFIGKYAEAEKLKREALADRREQRNGRPSSAVAHSAEILSRVLRMKGEFDEARALAHEAVEHTRTVFGESHPTNARRMREVGHVYRDSGDYAKSIEWYERARDVSRAHYGMEHREVHLAGQYLARVKILASDLEGVDHLLETAYAVLSAGKNEVNHSLHFVQDAIGWFNLASDRLDQAESFFNKSIASCHVSLPEAHVCSSYSLLGLAELSGVKGDLAQQRRRLEQVIELRTKALGANNWLTVQATNVLASMVE